MKHALIAKIDSLSSKKDITEFRVGDTVRVTQKVTEGNKTRSQGFEGIVIARKGVGFQENFTVRRISFGEGVEKTFPLHSATVQSVQVTRRGKVRKSKLFYLRKRAGKQTRIEEFDRLEAANTTPTA